jgi:hypothetical protein
MSLRQHIRNQKKRAVALNPNPVDPIAAAMDAAALVGIKEINEVFRILNQSRRALMQGCATKLQVDILTGSCTLAQAVEDLHIGTITGLTGHIAACRDALDTIRERYKASPQTRSERLANWGKTGLRFDEVDAIDTFFQVHKTQLSQLSRAEFTKAANLAAARAGGTGEKVEVVRDVQAFEQERMAA